MADKQTDRDNRAKRDQSWQFIEEKIVRQPLSKGRVIRLVLLTSFCAVLFGVTSAVSFVAVKPAVQRAFGGETAETDPQITIPKDDPESVPEAAAAPTETETEAVEERVRTEMENYSYSIDDLNKLYGNMKEIFTQADSCMAEVHSIQKERDWFDNPIENTGRFAGVIVAKTRDELLVLVPEPAIEAADSIEVCLADGTLLPGAVKQKDSVVGLAVVSVNVSEMGTDQYKRIREMPLGNSYSVKQGDLVIAVGAPAGIVRSIDYGFISYIGRNVQTVDGLTRIFYTDVKSRADAGTFLLNTAGELIGWVTDSYDQEGDDDMTRVVSISDYKGILELMTNGIRVPYLGVMGQEVTQAMAETGMPRGVYITAAVTDSPAYDAGIQPGDILVGLNGAGLLTMKEFQSRMEDLEAEQEISVTIERNNGKDEYKKIEFQVTIGAR